MRKKATMLKSIRGSPEKNRIRGSHASSISGGPPSPSMTELERKLRGSQSNASDFELRSFRESG